LTTIKLDLPGPYDHPARAARAKTRSASGTDLIRQALDAE